MEIIYSFGFKQAGRQAGRETETGRQTETGRHTEISRHTEIGRQAGRQTDSRSPLE